jgi:hypothetical protein
VDTSAEITLFAISKQSYFESELEGVMKRILWLMAVLATLLMVFPARPALADDDAMPLPVVQCQLNGGTPIFFDIDHAKPFELNGSYTCLWSPPPAAWNGDLVIFAHGYIDPTDPLRLPLDQLALTSPTLPELVVGMGYAFAVPTYAKNGLAVLEGVQAVEELAGFVMASPLGVNNIFLVGASEGGLITGKAIEHNPLNIFKGGMSACGPVGDFSGQINYWGDFRVLFDYFFPDFIPQMEFTPVHIADSTLVAWNEPFPGSLQYWITASLEADTMATTQLMTVSQAPFDPSDPTTIGESVLGILDYNIRATNEARMELAGDPMIDLTTNAGQPFDNNTRVYAGSLDDTAMNLWITNNAHRFSADPTLAPVLALYQTSGDLKAPLVTIHTTGDPIVPYWHEVLYQGKIAISGNSTKAFNIPVMRYGHCAFTAKESVFAFSTMILKATGSLPPLMTAFLTQQEYAAFIQLYGTRFFLPAISK